MIEDLMEKQRMKRKKREEEEYFTFLPCFRFKGREREEGVQKLVEERENRQGMKNFYNEMKKGAENGEAQTEWVPKICRRVEYS